VLDSKLITPEYQRMQAELHAKGGYGVASLKYGHLVAEIMNTLEITHLLDYGAGKMMNLMKALKAQSVKHKFTYQAYDPAVEELASAPIPAQMVACIDVLEHIEPDLLDNVLDHLAQLTECVLLATVHTGPAGKVLSNGRNAHLIQEPMQWWLPKFWERFEVQTAQVISAHGFHVIAYPKLRLDAKNGEKLIQ